MRDFSEVTINRHGCFFLQMVEFSEVEMSCVYHKYFV
jgi:hypothetical protein